MDITSYLLGKNAGGGGGADLSEYFNNTITSGSSSMAGYIKTLKKLPAISNTGTSCENMFSYFQGTEIDLSNFDTSNVYSMKEMFRGCTYLTTLDFSNFNTSNVSDMGGMFRGCETGLTELDLSSFDTSKVTDMNSMFLYTWQLTKLDIRNFTFSSVTNSSNMFGGVPADCLIIVKTDTEKAWILNVRSDLTNIKTVAEL